MQRINYDDLARLEYGRLFWQNPRLRAKLCSHWSDPRHPYRDRFQENRALLESVLEANADQDAALDDRLRHNGTSLRAVARQIPPVFGHFWGD